MATLLITSHCQIQWYCIARAEQVPCTLNRVYRLAAAKEPLIKSLMERV